MPELPEVETVRRGLQPALEGRRIERCVLYREDLRFPFPQGMVERLSGARVERLSRRAKYLIWELSQSDALIVHLGMSGVLRIHANGATVNPSEQRYYPTFDSEKHLHVRFILCKR